MSPLTTGDADTVAIVICVLFALLVAIVLAWWLYAAAAGITRWHRARRHRDATEPVHGCDDDGRGICSNCSPAIGDDTLAMLADTVTDGTLRVPTVDEVEQWVAKWNEGNRG